MTRKLSTTAAVTGLAAALGAGALVAVPAHAVKATGSTAAIRGSTANQIAGDDVPWYDTGEATATNPGPNRTVTLTAVADGPDIVFTVDLSSGPTTSPQSGIVAGHRLDAFVRRDGAPNTRGTHFPGETVAESAAAPSSVTFADGARINGRFLNVGKGDHTVTLTDVVLNVPSASSGGLTGTPAGFDTIYNKGTDRTIVTNPIDWDVKATVYVDQEPVQDKAAPVVKIAKPKKKAAVKGKSWKVIRGTLTDDRAPKQVNLKVFAKKKIQKKGRKAKVRWLYFDGSLYMPAKTKKKAVKQAATISAVPSPSGAWKVRLAKKAPKGVLYVRYWGTDLSGKSSAKKTLKQKITK